MDPKAFVTDKDLLEDVSQSTVHVQQVYWLACGHVVLSELFCSESKSQVYAALHELLMNWNIIRTLLSKLVIFVDMRVIQGGLT